MNAEDIPQALPYRKSRTKVPVPKADHEHEYVRPFTMVFLRRFDGTVTENKHRISTTPRCIECGRRKKFRNKLPVIEVEVSPDEFKRLAA